MGRTPKPTPTAAVDPGDFDVSPFLGGEFLSAEDVKDGPQRLQVAKVEVTTFDAKADQPARRQVVLTVAGDPVRKLSLNRTNLQTLADMYGKQTGAWIGQVFEAYFDAAVRNPSGIKTGGLRVRRPASLTAIASKKAVGGDDEIAF